MRASSWVGLGLLVAGFGYAQAALMLLDSPRFFLAWSVVAVGLAVAASGARRLPDAGPSLVAGLGAAAAANLYGILLAPGDVFFVLPTGAALLGYAVAAGVAVALWRDARASPPLAVVGRVALAVAGLAGWLYLVFEMRNGDTRFLVGDALAGSGAWLAAWAWPAALRAAP